MGKLYSFNLDQEKCVFYVKVDGYFTEEDAKVYISEFQTIVNTINPKNYTLQLDVRGQEAVENHVTDDIRFVLRIYASAKFSKIIIINPVSLVSKRQIVKCAKEIDFDAEFVDSVVEEALF